MADFEQALRDAKSARKIEETDDDFSRSHDSFASYEDTSEYSRPIITEAMS